MRLHTALGAARDRPDGGGGGDLVRRRLQRQRRSPERAFAFAFVRTGLSWRRRAERAGRGPHHTWDEHARILRRVSVRTRHFRGIGAHGVLTAAAEQGRRLDHSYPADPDGTLHLCRLDDHTRPA
ncbi:hypothetical protein [Streptomyces noursei]|uniref:hypothetical protein n=1 Tax=Streptomyces noursei TaxID=1971 RepID=UPI0035D7A749